MPLLTIISEKNLMKLEVKENTFLAEIISSSKLNFLFPCSQNKTCGKCKIELISGQLNNISQEERNLITSSEISNNIRLACFATVVTSATIKINSKEYENYSILSNISNNNTIKPLNRTLFKSRTLLLDKPTKSDHRDYFKRIKEALKDDSLQASNNVISKISNIIENSNFNINALTFKNFLLSIASADNPTKYFTIAVDIGTTTIAVYLINNQNGKVISTESQINEQKKYGDDVISRINYTLLEKENLLNLNQILINQLNNLLATISEKNNITIEQIVGICIVANTTIANSLLCLELKNIACSPFIPVFNDTLTCKASDLLIKINQEGILILLSGVSAYVGGDILAGIYQSEMFEKKEISLLIDIGTNGELAIGNENSILCCSTAAGPAFEGCHIKCGVGAVFGAINSVKIIDGQVTYTTIGNVKPIGICGSGILDAISEMLLNGIIDETGFLDSPHKINQETVFYICENIYITSKDIREIQLAKASICAGILTLIHESKNSIEDIEAVYLCGGFGNYMSKNSAINIGLIPKKLASKIVTIGNSAGNGAIRILSNDNSIEFINKIKQNTTYIELSLNKYFQESFIEEMIF